MRILVVEDDPNLQRQLSKALGEAGYVVEAALGIEEQRVNLVVGIDPGSGGLPAVGDGFRVEAVITVRLQESALMVPVRPTVRPSLSRT